MNGLNESPDDALDEIDEGALIEALKTKGLDDLETHINFNKLGQGSRKSGVVSVNKKNYL